MEKAKHSTSHIVLGAAGFLVSLYALAEHLKGSVTGTPLSCDISETVSCSRVFGSEYGEFLGIPLGAFGMAYFGILLTVALLPKMVEVSDKWIAQWRLLVSGIGLLSSVGLFYIATFKIKAVCPTCTTIHIINLLVFIISLIQFNKFKNSESVAHPNAFLKLVSTSLLFATPPLIAGVILPSIAPMIYGDSKAATATSAAPIAKPATPYPDDVLKINKSNFVGKGEDYRKGNDDAKIVMFMWSDFQCPGCRMAAEGIDKALNQYGLNRVLFVYKNYPLNSDCNPQMRSRMHPYACSAALAARCAGAQGKFWEFKEWAFSLQDLDGKALETAHSPESYAKKAASLGIDTARFQQCLNSPAELEKIHEDIADAYKIGITGTPMIIINGRKFQGDTRNTSAIIAAFEAASN